MPKAYWTVREVQSKLLIFVFRSTKDIDKNLDDSKLYAQTFYMPGLKLEPPVDVEYNACKIRISRNNSSKAWVDVLGYQICQCS